MRTTPLFALALVSLLAACGGGGGGGDTGTVVDNPVIGGTDKNTLEDQLGLVANTADTMQAASISGGVLANGQVTLVDNPGGLTLRSSLNSLQTGLGGTNAVNVMNGTVARTRDGGTVYYLPRPNSDVHVGMVHHVAVGDDAMAGLFGNSTDPAGMGNRVAAGGNATYTGQVEYSRDLNNQVVSYHGQIGASVDFDNGTLSTSTGTLAKISDTGGAAGMTLSGNGTFNGNGIISGSFATTSTDGNQAGSINGSFYGANGQNIGLLLIAPGAVGGAILDENP